VPGFPDLIESFVAGTIPEVPGWIVAGLEWRPPVEDRYPSSSGTWEAATDGKERDERLKRARGIARKVAGDLAMTREGGRNNALNGATAKLAGRAAWGGMSEAECRDLLAWACGINKLIRDDGWPAFEATFRSGWTFGLANPLRPPRERNVDDGGIVINLRPKLAGALHG
jgi:hypothetical protein